MKTTNSLLGMDYFILFTCGLAFVMALGLVLKPRNLRKNLLATILLCFSYIQVSSVLLESGLIYSFPQFMYTPFPLGSLIGPLFFLYGDTFVHEKKHLAAKDYLVFIPSLVVTVFSLPFALMPIEKKIEHINQFYSGSSLVMFLIFLSMSTFILFITLTALKIKNVYHRNNPLHAHFTQIFLIFLCWVVLVLLKMLSILTANTTLWQLVSTLFSVCIILAYLALQRKPFLLNYVTIAGDSTRKQSRNGFENEEAAALAKEIEMLMNEEKLFCDEDLSLARLAHALEVSPHQLSAFINEHYQKNFNAFINGYRVDYAKSLLDGDPAVSTLSVAFASGFNSYSSFYSTFRKFTGSAPGEYRGLIAAQKTQH